MSNAGSALMGIGTGVGENRAQAAARSAIASPLLEISMDGARGVLFNIIGGPDLTMTEVDEAAKIISSSADPDANIIFGATIDQSMHDQMKITVIATGFDQVRQTLKEFVTPMHIRQQEPVVEQDAQNQQSQNQDQPQPSQQVPPVEEEDDAWDIPAFLRNRN
jgi:cell division protein FtsZ